MDSNIKEEARRHATNWGMMAYVFPDKEESFIKGALSESAKEYWFKKFQEETPVVESWDELQIVDTDGNLKDGGEDDGHYGLCVRRNFLLSNYPNGVIIKPKQ